MALNTIIDFSLTLAAVGMQASLSGVSSKHTVCLMGRRWMR